MSAHPMGLAQDQPSDALRLARRLLRGSDGAEDLLQEAEVVKLNRAQGNARHQRASLALTIRYLAARTLRGARHRADRERAAARGEVVADSESAVLSAEDRRLVRDAVAALSPKSRATVVELYFEERSTAEMARREACSQRAIQKRETAALEELRAALGRRQGGERIWFSVLAPALPQRLRPWAQGALPVARPALLAVILGCVALMAVALVLALDGVLPAAGLDADLVIRAAEAPADGPVAALTVAVGGQRTMVDPTALRAVRCVDGATERPMAGARVTAWSGSSSDPLTVALVEGWLEKGQFDAHLGRSVDTGEADQAGCAVMELPHRPTLLTATDGAHWGWALASGFEDGTAELLMFLDTDVDVLFVDAGDRPARRTPVNLSALGYWGYALTSDMTDDRGRAALAHAGYLGWRARLTAPTAVGVDTFELKTFDGGGVVPAQLRLDGSDGLITLKHEESLWDVEFRFVEAGIGSAITVPIEASFLQRGSYIVQGRSTVTATLGDLNALFVDLPGGLYRVDRVVLGEDQLTCERPLNLDDGTHEVEWDADGGVTVRVDDASEILDRVACRLTVDLHVARRRSPEPDHPMSKLREVRGRLVNAHGAPMASCPVILTHGYTAFGDLVLTDKQGQFTFQLGDLEADLPTGLAIAADQRELWYSASVIEVVDWDLAIAPSGDVDLGEVGCPSGLRPMQIQGVVMDETEMPLSAVTVQWTGAGRGLSRAVTNQDGRFGLTIFGAGENSNQQHVVRLHHPVRGASRHVLKVSSGIEQITLAPPTEVCGKIVAPFKYLDGSLWVEAAFDAEDLQWHQTESHDKMPIGLVRAPVLGDGSFRLHGLSAGSYELKVSYYDPEALGNSVLDTAVLHRQPLDVAPALLSQHLPAIDLGAGILVGTVEFVDEVDHPVQGVRSIQIGMPGDCILRRSNVGQILQLVAPKGSTIAVEDERFYPTGPVTLEATCRILLRRREAVTAHIDGGLPGLGDGRRYVLRVSCRGMNAVDHELVADELASFLAIERGPHDFSLLITDGEHEAEVHAWSSVSINPEVGVHLGPPTLNAIQDALRVLLEASAEVK